MAMTDVQTAVGKDVFNVDIRLFTANDIKDDLFTVGDNGENYIIIKPEYWSNINIANDMFQLLPSIFIDIADPNIKNLTPYVGDGTVFLRVLIYDTLKKLQLDETFLIDDIQLVTMSVDSAIYNVTGSSARKVWMGQSISYATGYDSPKPISEIIEGVLDSATIDFYEEDENFVPTNGTIPYISPANSNIYDNLSYLFKRILIDDPSDGIYSLPYDMIKRKMIFTKINEKISKYVDVLKPHNELQFPSKDQTSPDKEVTIFDPTTKGNVGGSILSYDISSDNDINVFDHKSREWTIDAKSYDTITKLLPALITDYADGFAEETIMKTLPKYFQDAGIIYKNSTCNWYQIQYADMIQKVFKLTDSISLKCQGHLDRMPTDLFRLQAAENNSALSSRYTGIWLCAKIYMSFNKKEFHQELDLIRVNKKVFTS